MYCPSVICFRTPYRDVDLSIFWGTRASLRREGGLASRYVKPMLPFAGSAPLPCIAWSGPQRAAEALCRARQPSPCPCVGQLGLHVDVR